MGDLIILDVFDGPGNPDFMKDRIQNYITEQDSAPWFFDLMLKATQGMTAGEIRREHERITTESEEDMKKKDSTPYAMTEADLKNEILGKLNSLPGVFAYKHYSGGKYGLKGVHDIICCFHGVFVSIECKNPYTPAEYNPEQEKFAQWVTDAKGISMVVNKWSQVVERLKINEALLDPEAGKS